MTQKHRRLRANGGPGWSLSVSNGPHITNHSTARLRHEKCPATCGRSPSGSTHPPIRAYRQMGATDCGSRTVERHG
jgi:hypothetical protein